MSTHALLAALTRDLEWHKHAACRPQPGRDVSHLFLPVTQGIGHGLTRQERQQIAEAIAICASCPVRPRCRQDADEHHASFGVWAGELRGTTVERRPSRLPKQFRPLARSR